MTLEPRLESHIQGGWLAYCARARDVDQGEHCDRSEKNDEQRNPIEGRTLANRD